MKNKLALFIYNPLITQIYLLTMQIQTQLHNIVFLSASPQLQQIQFKFHALYMHNLRSSLHSLYRSPLPSSQALEFLSEKDLPQTMHLVIAHLVAKHKLLPHSYELSNVETHLLKFMKFIVQKNTSFVLKSSHDHIIGLSINLDIKDLLTLFETTIHFNFFEGIGIFTSNLKNWAYKLADCRKGDYLFNILTVFQQHQLGVGRRIDYVLRAMAFCKIIGWKSLLYPTADPFFFLKLGGEIFELLRNSANSHAAQKQLDLENTSIIENKTTELNLQNMERESVTYVLIMRMQKLNFVEFEYDRERIGRMSGSLEENQTTDSFGDNVRLCILPKL